MQPQTTRDFLALELATEFAIDQGRRMPELATWALAHWPDFLHLADMPKAEAIYGDQVRTDADDHEAEWAYMVALAGPCPRSNAEKVAWLEQLEAAEASFDREWAKK